MRFVFIFVLSLVRCSAPAFAGNHIRSVVPIQDQIIEIRTSLGIATIIQTNTAPAPAISGDQSGFRIEYLDKATIVKPLRFGAKTNLFLMTPTGRYNLRLVGGPEASADYVVYIRDVNSTEFRWLKYERQISRGNISFSVSRIGKSADGTLVVEALMRVKQTMDVKPDIFWIIQDRAPRIVDELYLSSSSVTPNAPLKIYLSIAKSDFDLTVPVQIEVRPFATKPLVLRLDGLWKI